jgi:hypothetical protein
VRLEWYDSAKSGTRPSLLPSIRKNGVIGIGENGLREARLVRLFRQDALKLPDARRQGAS